MFDRLSGLFVISAIMNRSLLMLKSNMSYVLMATVLICTMNLNINIQKIEINIHSAIAKTIKPDKSVS